MKNPLTLRRKAAAVIAVATLALAACSDADSDNAVDEDTTVTKEATDKATDESETAQSDAPKAQVTDMAGNVVDVPADPQSIVATDNRVFGTLADWGIELSAAPVTLMPAQEKNLDIYRDGSTQDIGNHREPNFEVVIAADPDLIINGQRFSQYEQEMRDAAPDAAFVVTDIDTENESIDTELRKLTTLLGDVFGHQTDAEKLIEDFDASIDAAQAAYDPEQTVAGLIVSGGSINYSAPTTGRSIGPVYDVLSLTPALDREGSTNHQGDDISVEAIAEVNPDWLIVLDRDAGAGTEGAESAQTVIEGSEALAGVTAVQKGQIVYLNPAFYTAEDIQHYTELFNDMAEAFTSAK